MSEPPKLSLKERIALLENKSKEDAAAAGPPPLRPKPAGGPTWKPKQQAAPSPPASPNPQATGDATNRKIAGVGGMSASDAKESIGKGGSLKERMAALQANQAGGFGGSPPPVGPKPTTEKPKWKPPPVIAKPESDPEDDSPAKAMDTASAPRDPIEAIQASEAAFGEPTDIEEKEEKAQETDAADEERQRRAAIAARMARLGGARVGTAPVFGKKPSATKPETLSSKEDLLELPAASSDEAHETKTAPVDEVASDVKAEDEPVSKHSSIELASDEVKTTIDTPNESHDTKEPVRAEETKEDEPSAIKSTRGSVDDTTFQQIPVAAHTENSSAPPTRKTSTFLSPTSEEIPDRSHSKSPSSMPVPAVPRRAAPPRKKAVKAPELEPEPHTENSPDGTEAPSKAESIRPELEEVEPTVKVEETAPVDTSSKAVDTSANTEQTRPDFEAAQPTVEVDDVQTTVTSPQAVIKMDEARPELEEVEPTVKVEDVTSALDATSAPTLVEEEHKDDVPELKSEAPSVEAEAEESQKKKLMDSEETSNNEVAPKTGELQGEPDFKVEKNELPVKDPKPQTRDTSIRVPEVEALAILLSKVESAKPTTSTPCTTEPSSEKHDTDVVSSRNAKPSEDVIAVEEKAASPISASDYDASSAPLSATSEVRDDAGRFLAERPSSPAVPVAADVEDEEEEAARRQRVAARMAKMGGFNPFAPKHSVPTPSTEEEEEAQYIESTPQIPITESADDPGVPSRSAAPSPDVTKLVIDSPVLQEDRSNSTASLSSVPAPPSSTEPSSGVESEGASELTDEEEESARRKRVSERLARMGGVNPFSAPRLPTLASASSESEAETTSTLPSHEGQRKDDAVEAALGKREEKNQTRTGSEPSHEEASAEEARPKEAPRRSMPPSPKTLAQLPKDIESEEEEDDLIPSPLRTRSPTPTPAQDEQRTAAQVDEEEVAKPVPNPRRSMPPPPRILPDVPDDNEPVPIPIPARHAPRNLPPVPPPKSESDSESEAAEEDEDYEEPLPTPPPRQSRPDRRSSGPVRTPEKTGSQSSIRRVLPPSLPTISTPQYKHVDEPEILDEAEGDPIDPGFHSPSPHGSFRITPPPQSTDDHPEEDAEAARRRTIAERMAKLGGIKFGAPMARPPPSTREKSVDAAAESEAPSLLSEEEEEAARKARISAKMAGMGMGMRYGMMPGQSPAPVAKKPEAEDEETPPPPPPRGRSAPSSGGAPSRAPPLTVSDSGASDDGVKVDAEESEIEEVTHSDAQEEEDLPPPVPTRAGRRSSSDMTPRSGGGGRPPTPVVPSDVSVRKASTSRRSSSEYRLTGSYDISSEQPGKTTRPQSFVMVDEPEDDAPPPPPRRSSRGPPTSSRTQNNRPPLETVDSVTSQQWETVAAPPIDFGDDSPDLSLSASSKPANQPTSSPPTELTPDELMMAWGRVGVHIFDVATGLFEQSKAGALSYGSFGVDAIIRGVPGARGPDRSVKPPTYGHVVYAQVGATVQRRASDIMPGDIVSLESAKFKAHGLLGHGLIVGVPDALHAVVSEFEPKKSKLKVFQESQHVGQQTVEATTYRLEDLKSGSIKIYRVLEA